LTKKLLLLDLLLAAALVWLALEVRDRWLEARKREQVVLGRHLKPLPPPPYAPLAATPPLTATAYAGVVEKNLFTPDRNPTVIVEVEAPKPMPDLPVFYGMMNLGDGPLVIMSAKANQSPREIHFGERVGEFTLLAASREEIVLEWDGKKITKRISELAPKAPAPAPAANASAPAAAQPPPPAAAPKSGAQVEAAPGAELGAGFRACQLGDTSPAGTVRDGMKKVVLSTPMGPSCRWEAAK
jgi:hypothetical protein